MKPFHTHYDNLMVSRNASPEVIRAAYKSLAQKYHPDRNHSNPDAGEIAKLINTSYDVLSDPARRKEHDAWIAEQEKKSPHVYPEQPQQPSQQTESEHRSRYTPPPASEVHAQSQTFASKVDKPKSGLNATTFFVSILLTIFLIVSAVGLKGLFDRSHSEPATAPAAFPAATSASTSDLRAQNSAKDYEMEIIRSEDQDVVLDLDPEPFSPNKKSAKLPASTPVNTRDGYVRSLVSPTGFPWPLTAGYLQGYAQKRTNGYANVTIDNTGNDSDVHVKLMELNARDSGAVRNIFIPAGSKFTMNKIASGSYDVRYRDLKSGALARTEQFDLNEERTPGGITFSNVTMTLYKVVSGNMQTSQISENEFYGWR